MKKFSSAFYTLAMVLATAFCVARAMGVPVENPPPGGPEIYLSALSHKALIDDKAPSPEEAGKLLPLLKELASLEEKREKVFLGLTLALDEDQKKFIEKEMDRPGGLYGDPAKTAGYLLLPGTEKPDESGGILNKSSRPFWPGREPLMDELTGGILLLYQKNLLKPRQKVRLAALLMDEAKLAQKIQVEYNSKIDVIRSISEPYLTESARWIPPAGPDYGRRHTGIIYRFTEISAKKK